MVTFSIQDEISHAWQLVKKDWWFFGGVSLISAVLYGIPQVLAEIFQQESSTFALLFWILSLVIYVVIEMGLVTIGFKTLDGKPKATSDLLSTTKPFWAYLIMTVLFSLMTYAGILALVLPGIYLTIKGIFAGPLLLEKNLGPVESIKQSFKITKGYFWKLLSFCIVLLLVNILGVLALGVGLLWSGPVTLLAFLSVYRKLSGTHPTVPTSA